MSLKILWYCTKAQPFLYHDIDYCYDSMNTIDLGYKTYEYTNFRIYDDETGQFLGWDNMKKVCEDESLNGKIVAESDFEVEEITHGYGKYGEYYQTKTLGLMSLREHSCISSNKLSKYLKRGDEVLKVGYAIHIKNLHVFDKPKELSEYYKTFERMIYHPNEYRPNVSSTATPSNAMYFMDYCDELTKAPQNMCYAFDKYGNKYVLISVHSEWLAMILNGLKTIEVRKKVLKEML